VPRACCSRTQRGKARSGRSFHQSL
jgi:hypothetical protein